MLAGQNNGVKNRSQGNLCVSMKIWVDADSCPVVIKEILYKAAARRGVWLTLVANRFMKIPPGQGIDFLQVKAGLDVADKTIVKNMKPGDLVITNDIPLASDVIEKGGLAINPRGVVYSVDNIKERLSTRDFMDSLRSCGIDTGGPASLNKKDKQNFANALDRILTQLAG